MLSQASIHLGIPTTNFEKSLDFYQNTLGLERSIKHLDVDGIAIFTASGGGMIELYTRGEKSVAAHTIGGFTVENIEQEVAELKAKGVKFEEYDSPGFKTVNSIAQTSPKSRCAWFKDPEGHFLVITEVRE